MTALLEGESNSCRLCQNGLEKLINLQISELKTLIHEKTISIEKIMAEREKAAITAAQALVTKDGQDQMAKFVLKQELDERIDRIQKQITGPLGLELRMRNVEQESHGAADREKRIGILELARGAIDSKMYMIIVGLSAMITAIMTIVLHVLFKL